VLGISLLEVINAKFEEHYLMKLSDAQNIGASQNDTRLMVIEVLASSTVINLSVELSSATCHGRLKPQMR
jgi:hypothetical protein